MTGISRAVVAIAAMAVWVMPLFAHERVVFSVAMIAALAIGIFLARRVALDTWLLDAANVALIAAVGVLGCLIFRPTALAVVVEHGLSWNLLMKIGWYGVLCLPPIATLLWFITRPRLIAQRPPPYYYGGFQ